MQCTLVCLRGPDEMILLCGIFVDRSLVLVARALRELGVEYAVLDQRTFFDCGIEMEFDGVHLSGTLHLPLSDIALEDISGVYLRLVDPKGLPELAVGASDVLQRVARSMTFHGALLECFEVLPARVINRPSAGLSNYSKPFQAQLLRAAGFDVPEILISNDIGRIREFHAMHGRLVYKSLSDNRSVVRLLEAKEVGRFAEMAYVPVLFQEYIEGSDLRVHVIGERVFGTRIESGVTDYRYAEEGSRDFEPVEIGDDLMRRCIQVTREFGLLVSGIDFRVSGDGRLYCLEINPNPTISFFEENSGNTLLSRSLARFLGGSTK